jgi:hypothetical protein
MRQGLTIGLIALFLGACTVRLPIIEATATPLTAAEVQHLNEVGEGASVPGTWFRVTAILPRSAVRKITRWELYTHLYVEDCRTGDVRAVVSSATVGSEGDFERVRELLKLNPNRAAFQLSGPAFFQDGKSRGNLCLRIDGGSYTLQKIATDKVPLQFQRA